MAASSRPSCASRSCAVRSVSPVRAGTIAARWPALSQTRSCAAAARRAGGGLLRDDAAGGDLRVRPPECRRRATVKPELAGERRGVVRRAVGQIGHLHLARAKRQAHRGGGKQHIGARPARRRARASLPALQTRVLKAMRERSYYKIWRTRGPRYACPGADRSGRARVVRTRRRRRLRAVASGKVRRCPRASMTAGGSAGCTAARRPVRSRRAGQKRVDDRFVLFRLARTGGVDSRPPGATPAAWRSIVELGRRQRRQIGLAGAATGCRDPAAACQGRSRARRRARSRRRARKGSGCSRSAWTRRTLVAPLAATVRRSSSMRRSRTSQATSRPRARHAPPPAPSSCRRATRTCRARARRGRRRRAARPAATLRPARRTSRHPRPSPRSGCPSLDDQRVRREASAAWSRRRRCREPRRSSCGVGAQRIGAQRQRRRLRC